jgi:3-hydroxybutyryl-CoA dehydrogenase
MSTVATATQPVLVVGAGTMGNGIAQVFAAAGRPVLLTDSNEAALRRGLEVIGKSLDRLVKKGTIDAAAKEQTLARIHSKRSEVPIAECALAVEAVPENADLKKSVLKELDRELPPAAILATNTSSISISELAAATGRPGRFVGMHFMNPVPVMALVEVVRGLETTEETVREVSDLAKTLGKTPVVVNDLPGFVSNRILMPMINEAATALMEGVADREAIDTVMRLGMNHPMGPLTLADFIGLDVCLAILQVLHDGLGDPKYRPCPLLKRMVAAGYLGRKSGQGFYNYKS